MCSSGEAGELHHLPTIFLKMKTFSTVSSTIILHRKLSRKMTFENFWNSGEAGELDHLVTTFLTAESINHGITMRSSPTLQYLHYIEQIGLVCVCVCVCVYMSFSVSVSVPVSVSVSMSMSASASASACVWGGGVNHARHYWHYYITMRSSPTSLMSNNALFLEYDDSTFHRINS